MTRKVSERQKDSNAGSLQDNSSESRDDVIARLLQARAGDTSGPPQSGPARPIIEDANVQPNRPKFEMPDMTGSASLLARVQSFLPQLQQANTSLPVDHAGGSAFELVEENSDDEEDNEEKPDIKHRHSEDPDQTSDDDDAEEAGPQIVMNLALGVLEEKKPQSDSSSSSDDESSDEDSTDDESSPKKVDTVSLSEDHQTDTGAEIKTSTRSEKRGQPEKRSLIQELS